MLSRVKIEYLNGSLGTFSPNTDGVLGLVAQAQKITDESTGEPKEILFEFEKPYILNNLESLVDLGITESEDYCHIYKFVKEFYSEASDGTELWLIISEAENISKMLSKDVGEVGKHSSARKLIEAANGKLKGIAAIIDPEATQEDTAVENETAQQKADRIMKGAMLSAQNLAEWATETLYAPIFVLLEGHNYLGDAVELLNLKEYSYNRVGVIIGDTVENSGQTAIGLLAGRVASIPVQRNISRVKDGAVSATDIFIKDKAPELANNESIHDNGYITFRNFVGKAGYFFSDDCLATSDSDDYRSLARRRTIDKAYRIAYQTLIQELGDEIPVTDEGYMAPSMIKTWQTNIETAIINQMGSEGNLGSDPSNSDDTGVLCEINPTQNIIATERIEISLRIKPYGYAKYIDVKLGFKTINA